MARATPKKRRKIEAHNLTISGLKDEVNYVSFLRHVRELIPSNKVASHLIGGKTHALSELTLKSGKLRFLFFSFAGQDRPDVLDMDNFSIEESPLDDNQTGIYWTHAIGGTVEDHFILAVEKHQPGIWPSSIEQYLQWMIDTFFYSGPNPEKWWEDSDRITVSIEAVPGGKFLARLRNMARITKATVRTVRPNPGWADLDRELGREASESDAHKVEVVMTARRNESLSKDDGIIDAIKRMARDRTLAFAAIEGKEQEDQPAVSFNTEKLGKQTLKSISVDANGQLERNAAWNAIDEAFSTFND